ETTLEKVDHSLFLFIDENPFGEVPFAERLYVMTFRMREKTIPCAHFFSDCFPEGGGFFSLGFSCTPCRYLFVPGIHHVTGERAGLTKMADALLLRKEFDKLERQATAAGFPFFQFRLPVRTVGHYTLRDRRRAVVGEVERASALVRGVSCRCGQLPSCRMRGKCGVAWHNRVLDQECITGVIITLPVTAGTLLSCFMRFLFIDVSLFYWFAPCRQVT
ncbi:MAG TPA: hypothetical protein VFU15_01520, partial [Bacteroidia bacterium]|nr:hypothetical protein [Bacteroidia bacterium]